MSNTDYSKLILEAIQYGIDNNLKDALFDKTLICTVIDINGNNVTVTNSGTEYLVVTKNVLDLQLMSKVHMVIPQNKNEDKFLLEDIAGVGGSGSSSGTVFSVNGKKGTVVIGIDDISGLRAALNNGGGGSSIITSQTMPTAQTSGQTWYEIEETSSNGIVTYKKDGDA